MTIKAITKGALAVALVYISFFLFKGPLNILNALFIPLLIYLFTLNHSRKEVLAQYIMIIFFCLLFFNIQLFFMLFYCVIAAVLTILNHKKVKGFPAYLILTLITGICFWLGILFTDFAFHTQINRFMLDVLNNNYIIYSSMILVEAAIVSGLSTLFAKFFTQRVMSKQM